MAATAEYENRILFGVPLTQHKQKSVKTANRSRFDDQGRQRENCTGLDGCVDRYGIKLSQRLIWRDTPRANGQLRNKPDIKRRVTKSVYLFVTLSVRPPIRCEQWILDARQHRNSPGEMIRGRCPASGVAVWGTTVSTTLSVWERVVLATRKFMFGGLEPDTLLKNKKLR
jgi:hypothetical protein